MIIGALNICAFICAFLSIIIFQNNWFSGYGSSINYNYGLWSICADDICVSNSSTAPIIAQTLSILGLLCIICAMISKFLNNNTIYIIFLCIAFLFLITYVSIISSQNISPVVSTIGNIENIQNGISNVSVIGKSLSKNIGVGFILSIASILFITPGVIFGLIELKKSIDLKKNI